jgi:SAM-dependent methyltransferase
MTLPTCFCGSTKNTLVVEGDYSFLKVNDKPVHFRALKCLDCDLVFTDPPPITDASLYQSYYYEEKAPNQEWITHYGNYRISRLGRYLNSSSKVLEIGCAEGDFVDRVRQWGVAESIGVELSLPTANAGRALGRNIRDGDVQGCQFPTGYFDIVQAHHVLEHVHDLRGFLGEIHRITKPGGLFYVSLPRYNSRYVGKDPTWYGWYPQQHFWHFSDKTLTKLLNANQFKLVDMAVVRAANYFPVQCSPGLLHPVKVAVKKLINQTVKTFKLGDLIDAFYQVV